MSDNDVDKFLAEFEAEKKTKLPPWESQIFELLSKNASYETIKSFLKAKNVEVDRSAIIQFVKAKKRAHLYEKAMQQRGKPIQPKPAQEKPGPQGTQLKEPSLTESTDPVKSDNARKPGQSNLPGFVWDVKNKPKVEW